jgi:hypothetical protein
MDSARKMPTCNRRSSSALICRSEFISCSCKWTAGKRWRNSKIARGMCCDSGMVRVKPICNSLSSPRCARCASLVARSTRARISRASCRKCGLVRSTRRGGWCASASAPTVSSNCRICWLRGAATCRAAPRPCRNAGCRPRQQSSAGGVTRYSWRYFRGNAVATQVAGGKPSPEEEGLLGVTVRQRVPSASACLVRLPACRHQNWA